MTFLPLSIIFNRLSKSSFRSNFTLNKTDQFYLQEKGLDKIMLHAADFIDKRLAPAFPKNDGKQTPWKGHPVFVAQHATATCCRGCLEKWYQITKQKPLTQEEKAYILSVIKQWLENHQ